MQRFHFQGLNRYPSYCYVEVFQGLKSTLVVATSPEENDMGTSVTNAWPFLADAIIEEFNLDLTEKIIWVEHYPVRGHGDRFPESWDQVFMERMGRNHEMVRGRHPWRHLEESDFEKLLEGVKQEN